MLATTPGVIGELLVERGALSSEALDRALERQRGSGSRLGAVLLDEGLVGGEELAAALAAQLGLPFQEGPLPLDPAAARLVHPDLARRRRVLPIAATSKRVTLAMADPLDLATIDDVRFQVGRRVEPVVATEDAVLAGLDAVFETYEDVEGLLSALPSARDEQADRGALEREARAMPVVRLVDHVLQQAVRDGASDVHVEDQAGALRVRYRIDGVLRQVLELPRSARRAVLSRIKIMAGLDIAVRRRPQDGAIALAHQGRTLSVRVSTLPVNGGEKAVMRLLDPDKAPTDLDGLGLAPDALSRLRGLVKTRQGVVLAAGPTGSGKSSTLYGALQEVDRDESNVVTLEDPIEYRLQGANQVQVDPKAGLTFPAALRSVLRQDPDVVMVGEIRDRETAEIAMSAAVTGHLVLSTIHTAGPPESGEFRLPAPSSAHASPPDSHPSAGFRRPLGHRWDTASDASREGATAPHRPEGRLTLGPKPTPPDRERAGTAQFGTPALQTLA